MPNIVKHFGVMREHHQLARQAPVFVEQDPQLTLRLWEPRVVTTGRVRPAVAGEPRMVTLHRVGRGLL